MAETVWLNFHSQHNTHPVIGGTDDHRTLTSPEPVRLYFLILPIKMTTPWLMYMYTILLDNWAGIPEILHFKLHISVIVIYNVFVFFLYFFLLTYSLTSLSIKCDEISHEIIKFTLKSSKRLELRHFCTDNSD